LATDSKSLADESISVAYEGKSFAARAVSAAAGSKKVTT